MCLLCGLEFVDFVCLSLLLLLLKGGMVYWWVFLISCNGDRGYAFWINWLFHHINEIEFCSNMSKASAFYSDIYRNADTKLASVTGRATVPSISAPKSNMQLVPCNGTRLSVLLTVVCQVGSILR